MKETTRRALNAINRRFYRERASEFSETRERPWRGWESLWERIGAALPSELRVLDVGCGNGRFARFLIERHAGPLAYAGVDASELGLDEARRRLAHRPGLRWFEHDFITGETLLPDSVEHERYDLVVLFGVLHHVPGREDRLRLLSALGERLAPGGFLAFAVWRFDRFDRFRKKLVSWDAYLRESDTPLDATDLEPGDHILTWGGGDVTFRYCHAVSDEEVAHVTDAVALSAFATFDGDDALNRYVVLRSPC